MVSKKSTTSKAMGATASASGGNRVRAGRPKAAKTANRLPGVPFDLPRVNAEQLRRAAALRDMLAESYPDAHCELNHSNAHELLIATICSAQTTDVGVNKCTPALFAAYPTPADYAKATPEEIEPYIRTIGLFRSKAKSICQTTKELTEKFGGQVPRTMDELLTLRGVARKTANVVLGNAFGINVGFVVDTHVHRLSQRLGLVPVGTPVAQCEKLLMACFAAYQDEWCMLSHRLIFHGRRGCPARGMPTGCCSQHQICRGLGDRCELRVTAKSKGGGKAGPKSAGKAQS